MDARYATQTLAAAKPAGRTVQRTSYHLGRPIKQARVETLLDVYAVAAYMNCAR